MAYIVDILIVVIFLIVVIVAAVKGLFRSLFDLLGSLLAVIIARLVSQSVAPTVFSSFLRDAVETSLSQKLGPVGTTDYAQQAQQALDSIPEALNGVMAFMGIDRQAIIEKINSANLGGDNLLDTLMNNVIEPVGTAIVQFILFAALCLLLTLIIKLLVKLLDSIIKKLPIAGKLNHTLGAVFGVLQGLITVTIILMVVNVVASFVNVPAVTQALESSVIMTYTRDAISFISGAVA